MKFLRYTGILSLVVLGIMGFGLHPELGGAQDQEEQPSGEKLNLSIYNMEGSVQRQRDGKQQTPEEGDVIREGDVLKTDENSTAALVIPGVNYITLEPGTELAIHELKKRTETRGLLFSQEEVKVNELMMEAFEGQINSTSQENPDEEMEFEVFTPNAVAGVRGTTFELEAEPGQFTEVGVLEGEVEFQNRENREIGVSVGERQKSRLESGQQRPTEPEQLEEERVEKLNQYREQGQDRMREPPVVSSVSLDGGALSGSNEFSYPASKSMELSGKVQLPEEGAQLEGLEVRIDGEAVDVEPSTEWSVEWSPQAPSQGEEIQHTIEVRAVDSYGNASEVRTIGVTLIHQENQSPWPTGLDQGSVSLKAVELGQFILQDMEFPLHLYRGDLENGVIPIKLEASGTLEGLAVTMDGGQSWQTVENPNRLNVDPQALSEGGMEVLGWTASTVGEVVPVEELVGEVEYSSLRYNEVWARQIREFFRGMERQDERLLRGLLSDDFIFEFSGGGSPDGTEKFSRDEFLREMVREDLSEMDRLRIRSEIERIFGGPEGGQAEIQFQFEFEQTESFSSDGTTSSSSEFHIGINFVQNGKVDFIRDVNGEFQISYIAIQGMERQRQYFWDQDIQMGVGLSSTSCDVVSIDFGFFVDAGYDCLNLSPSFVGIEDGADTTISLYSGMGGGQYGIQELNASSWSQVDSLPSSGYQSQLTYTDSTVTNLEDQMIGKIFAVHFERTFDGTTQTQTGAFEIVDYFNGSGMVVDVIGAQEFTGDFDNPDYRSVFDYEGESPR